MPKRYVVIKYEVDSEVDDAHVKFFVRARIGKLLQASKKYEKAFGGPIALVQTDMYVKTEE